MESFFPTLYTARCTLRRIGPADKLRVFEGLSHPEVIRYYGVSYRTLEETQAQLDWYNYLLASETGIWWGICFTSDPGRLIGACGFNEWVQMHNRAETGYWLLPGYWGQGLMRECLSAILRFAFANMRLHPKPPECLARAKTGIPPRRDPPPMRNQKRSLHRPRLLRPAEAGMGN
jgi:ribosomal-protein-alanine N-acetyltransferase